MNKYLTIAKKYWKQIAIGILAVFLLIILFRGCGDVNDLKAKNKELNAQVQDKNKTIQESFNKFSKDSTEMQQEINRMDTVIHSLASSLNIKETDLKKTGAQVRRLLREAGEALPNDLSDSIDLIVRSKIDSAAREFDELSIKYASLEYNMDALIEMQSKKDSVQDAQLQSAYAELKQVREAYAAIFVKYNILYKDFQTVAKKTKHARFLNKLLAAGLLTTGTLLLLK